MTVTRIVLLKVSSDLLVKRYPAATGFHKLRNLSLSSDFSKIMISTVTLYQKTLFGWVWTSPFYPGDHLDYHVGSYNWTTAAWYTINLIPRPRHDLVEKGSLLDLTLHAPAVCSILQRACLKASPSIMPQCFTHFLTMFMIILLSHSIPALSCATHFRILHRLHISISAFEIYSSTRSM